MTMICKVHGILESLTDNAANITPDGGLTYEVRLPAFAIARLGDAIDKPVTLHTVEYLEGSAQGNNFTPRLIGFINETDREFFSLFTSVKGIGPRKAMRAMSLPVEQIAAAIADRDVKTLQSLPEIGRRTAESIVAELHGKVENFIKDTTYRQAAANENAPASPTHIAAREALEVLLQLGENRTQTIRWIDEVMIKNPDLEDAQMLVAEVLRLKTGK